MDKFLLIAAGLCAALGPRLAAGDELRYRRLWKVLDRPSHRSPTSPQGVSSDLTSLYTLRVSNKTFLCCLGHLLGLIYIHLFGIDASLFMAKPLLDDHSLNRFYPPIKPKGGRPPLDIGAGRGSRLNALTLLQPKCYVKTKGLGAGGWGGAQSDRCGPRCPGDHRRRRRIADLNDAALSGCGMRTAQPSVRCWQMDRGRGADPEARMLAGRGRVRDAGLCRWLSLPTIASQIQADYPHLTYCHNADWQHNNILASLFCAEEYMADGFVCSYADILYRPTVVRRALEHEGDIALCVDTDWRTRYADRSQHPEDDAEKIVAEGDRVVEVNRAIAAPAASGEYIGVARFSVAGTRFLRAHYQRMKAEYAGQTWKDGTPFEKAYLIHLFQEMLDAGLALHMVPTDGEYMEIDTEEDLALANARWSNEYGG